MQTYEEFLREWEDKAYKWHTEEDGYIQSDADQQIAIDLMLGAMEAQRQWFLSQWPKEKDMYHGPVTPARLNELVEKIRNYEDVYNQALSDCRKVLEGKS